MKNHGLIALLLALLLLMPGCSLPPVGKAVPAGNHITPVELGDDQRQLLQIMGSQQEVALFKIQADPLPAGVEVWVECYQNGVQLEDAARLHMMFDEAHPDLWQDHIAVIFQRKPEITWTLASYSEDGNRATHTGDAIPRDPRWEDTGMGMGYGAEITDPTPLQTDQAVLLYFAFINTGTGQFYTNHPQESMHNPDVLKQYELAFLVKCRLNSTAE